MVKQIELTKDMLQAHHVWLNCRNKGKKLSLKNADITILPSDAVRHIKAAELINCKINFHDLRNFSFNTSNLRGTSFEFSNLTDACFFGADLRDCNFLSTNLCGVIFSGCKGFYLLPVQDMRGHSFIHAQWVKDEWRIRGGCRDFSIPEARKHFNRKHYDQEFAAQMRYAINWLVGKIKNEDMG